MHIYLQALYTVSGKQDKEVLCYVTEYRSRKKLNL